MVEICCDKVQLGRRSNEIVPTKYVLLRFAYSRVLAELFFFFFFIFLFFFFFFALLCDTDADDGKPLIDAKKCVLQLRSVILHKML